MPEPSAPTALNFLIRGNDYVAQHADFKLVGRDEELHRLSRILMRSRANSVLLVGAGGVGCTALCMGLQASKADLNAPFDIVSKRLFWLDTDGLFASGDPGRINESFQKILTTLSRTPETVLIIEDTRDFVEAARNTGCTHLINALMREVKNGKFQAILEARDDDLEAVLKCHSDLREIFTLLDIQEPGIEALRLMAENAAQCLEKYHQLRIAPEAREAAIELTSKYRVRDMSLSRAQPERTVTLLDRALTSYRQKAHARPPELDDLESRLGAVNAALAGTRANGHGLEGKTPRELAALRAALESEMHAAMTNWEQRQTDIRKLYKDQRDGEEAIRELEAQLEIQRQKEQEARSKAPAAETEVETPVATRPTLRSFIRVATAAGFESKEVTAIKTAMAQYQQAVDDNRTRYEALTAEINQQLLLTREHVLAEFSRISGIPVSKLNQDERVKLLALDQNLAARVFGQDHVVQKLGNAVRVARVGLKEPNKPQAAFMFLGPSGVGKTELAKALTATLFDDEKALLRFDMSEYMEKHAVARLIGAPPGYEGYEAGGILTNAMRRNPLCVILFDEIEKAHPDVFNIFLQILDDARLTDNRGLTVSFSEAIIIMTTNIGTPHFLDESLDFVTARQQALADLEEKYRPEFLNRFNGRQHIVCFNRLELPVIARIAARELSKLNERIKGAGLQVVMPADHLSAMCQDHYAPGEGARGITGYFTTHIHPAVANTILMTPEAQGSIQVRYNTEQHGVEIDPPQAVAANDTMLTQDMLATAVQPS